MTLLVCLDCSTAFAVGVPRCPHCGSERKAEEGTAAAMGLHARGRVEEEPMPKITVYGGPSDRADIQAPEPEPEASEAAEGGEDVSAGSSGETSSRKPSQKPEPSSPRRQSRARGTGSRSKQAPAEEESSTAPSTDTSGPATDVADEESGSA